MSENLANAIQHIINAVSAVASSTPSGAPHGMTWLDNARAELAKFWAELHPPAEAAPMDAAGLAKFWAELHPPAEAAPMDAGVPSDAPAAETSGAHGADEMNAIESESNPDGEHPPVPAA